MMMVTQKAQHGSVMVLTLLALATLLGVVGLAVDIGFMFDYKQRAQIAADAAAIAAFITPGTLATKQAAALQIAKDNSFDDAAENIVITVVTPPSKGAYMATSAGRFYEATVTLTHPTFLLNAIGVSAFPITVRAVAGSQGAGGNCLTAGETTIRPNTKLTASGCDLYFGDFTSYGAITADTVNILKGSSILIPGDITGTINTNVATPAAPGVFPDPSVFANATKSVAGCKKQSITAGAYQDITVTGDCIFGGGVYSINKSLTFDANAKVTATGNVTILLNSQPPRPPDTPPDPKYNLKLQGSIDLAGGTPGYPDILIWSKGKRILFDPNAKVTITGHIYAPGVPLIVNGTYDWSVIASKTRLLIE